jgi:hypothetical protein
MMFINIKIQKTIAGLIIFGTLLPSFSFLLIPKHTYAVAQSVPVTDANTTIINAQTGVGNAFKGAISGSTATTAAYGVKEWAAYILGLVLQAIARRAIQEITKSTVNWINSGFHGSPLFVENPESFFKDIVKSEVKNLVDTFGYDRIRFPFGKDFAINTINSYKNTLEGNTQYTLSTVSNDRVYLNNYRNNFSVGGWDGFLVNNLYPQNNYIGFHIIATEELSRRIDGAIQPPIEKVNALIQQGQGFLSPQVCPSNSAYNNGYNEFRRPSFDSSTWAQNNPAPQQPDLHNDDYDPNNPTHQTDPRYEQDRIAVDRYNDEVNDWNEASGQARENWKEDNTCPGGLVNTTPGVVVSNQIMNAMGSQLRQSELGAAMGNSLSAIFDALLNKFLNEGLNALASSINNDEPPEDNWTYSTEEREYTLGDDSSSDWSTTADEIVILAQFRRKLTGYDIGTCSGITSETGATNVLEDISKEECDRASGTWTKNIGVENHVDGDIDRTNTEITLMDNPPCSIKDTQACPTTSTRNPNNSAYAPGIIQRINTIWEKTQVLDQCLPGPDKGWTKRLQEEHDRVTKPIATSTSSDPEKPDELKAKDAHGAIRDLKFAVDSFKDWITNKMMSSLPNAITYMDAINSIDDLPQQLQETKDKVQAKRQAVARLKTIKSSLDTLAGVLLQAEKLRNPLATEVPEPTPGSPEEDRLITLWKQYKALSASISSTFSIEDTRNELNTLKDRDVELYVYSLKPNTFQTVRVPVVNPKIGDGGVLDFQDPENPTVTTSDDLQTTYRERRVYLPDPNLNNPSNGLIPECLQQRFAAGWTAPDPSGKGLAPNSLLTGKPVVRKRIVSSQDNDIAGLVGFLLTGDIITGILGGLLFDRSKEIIDKVIDVRWNKKGTELETFCELPIVSGHSHGDIIRNSTSSYMGYSGGSQALKNFRFLNLDGDEGSPGFRGGTGEEDPLPLVNAQHVFGDTVCTGLCSMPLSQTNKTDKRVNIRIDCNTIFKANKIDYTHAGDPNF